MEPSLIRFLTFSAMMSAWIYTPIFAKNLGVSDLEIGFMVSSLSLALFLSSFVFGRASDRYGRRLFLLAGLGLSGIALFLHVFARDFPSLLLVRVFIGFSAGMYPASLVAYVHENRKDLSRFSSFGSLGWASGSIVGGIIAAYLPVEYVFIFSASLCVPALFASTRMRFGQHRSLAVPAFPLQIIRKNLSLYLSVLIRHTGAQMIWTFWPLFLQALGADLFWIGLSQALNSLTQFVFMYTLSSRIAYIPSIAGGLILSCITFFSFTLATNFWYILPMEILLGVSWSLLYVGGLRYLMDRNPEKATASALFDSVLSLSSVAGPFLATLVISFAGYTATMLSAAILALTSFLIFLRSNTKLLGNTGPNGQT